MGTPTGTTSAPRLARGSGLLRCPDAEHRSDARWLERYVGLRPIAAGGVGTVHAARDVQNGRTVAVKVLHPEHADSAEMVSRFLGELEVGLRVQHAGLVRMHDGGFNADGLAMIVMDWVDGDCLANRVGAPMPVATVCALGAQIADAIAALHGARIVHCPRIIHPSWVINRGPHPCRRKRTAATRGRIRRRQRAGASGSRR